jgi:hypothetical protein
LLASRVGILVYSREFRPDVVLRQAVDRLKSTGVHVGGLLQDGSPDDAGRCGALFLEDIQTGRRVQAFEIRGADTPGCRLDLSSLVKAGGWLRAAIETRPDVLFINRFGRQESGGRGLRDEIAAAIETGLPVVIAINKAFLPEWHAFVGMACADITADPTRIEAWCLDHLGSAISASGNPEPGERGAPGGRNR